ncbi:SRPBCC domain-containing protein [Maritimibacter sp. DP1N21-5]|uniref:SRPBCC domain-containing protein n=1 Tax=Maritimibacter sp. DP1N21-5 TaxID=2836867 RepID=UPI001C458E3E|nr:SRPBCC domain-containing protein [Maritimibacter sp. DP1N21-5]MBV7408619.1 SRPBCC domain-containing protein [Maritimibacter sp. DP1N21-5]
MADPKVKAATLIHGAPTVVYEAFTDPEQLTRFWFPVISGPLEAGAEVTFALGEEPDAMCIDVKVDEARPGEVLSFDWGPEDHPTRVTFRFTEKGPTTELSVTETGHSAGEEENIAAWLDSQGGFNQLVIAAKAWVEHGVSVQIVTDRAG